MNWINFKVFHVLLCSIFLLNVRLLCFWSYICVPMLLLNISAYYIAIYNVNKILYLYRHIRRIIFYSLIQPTINEKGEKEMDVLSVSAALQIAGRAGRYGTAWATVNICYFARSLNTLSRMML